MKSPAQHLPLALFALLIVLQQAALIDAQTRVTATGMLSLFHGDEYPGRTLGFALLQGVSPCIGHLQLTRDKAGMYDTHRK